MKNRHPFNIYFIKLDANFTQGHPMNPPIFHTCCCLNPKFLTGPPEAEIFPPLERVLPSTAPLRTVVWWRNKIGFILVGGSEIMQNPTFIINGINDAPKFGDSWVQVNNGSHIDDKLNLCELNMGGETLKNCEFHQQSSVGKIHPWSWNMTQIYGNNQCSIKMESVRKEICFPHP